MVQVGNWWYSRKIRKGKEGRADTSFILLDKDMVRIATGKLEPMTAYMDQIIEIKGNISKAMKFTPDLMPISPKLW